MKLTIILIVLVLISGCLNTDKGCTEKESERIEKRLCRLDGTNLVCSDENESQTIIYICSKGVCRQFGIVNYEYDGY
jgi:hypothetical protein